MRAAFETVFVVLLSGAFALAVVTLVTGCAATPDPETVRASNCVGLVRDRVARAATCQDALSALARLGASNPECIGLLNADGGVVLHCEDGAAR